MSKIPEQLAQVQNRVHAALAAAGRAEDAALLLAVSKTKSAAAVREAFGCGQTCFGENYLQEALEKQQQLQDLPIEWHFIGPIQSNKTRAIAENFDWVHSVDRARIAVRLNDQRPPSLPPLNVCVQVNIDAEPSKAGVLPEELPEVLESVAQLPRLRLRGLMAIPAPRSDHGEQQKVLLQVASLLQEWQQRYPQLDTLSMGMSGDLEAAIAAGATIVRVGTDIFGAR
ncbi:YggS family pyridoxal phosphate-dependent enzyme [Pseudomaricurvus sp. HS19]|uniref:YggS family pyridoxal phosphate-dependent enzyme n=1 Tax=Pseudomaricurvus sp. HS19 TaxID=2692626 RepID=UPI001370C89A|nr:YggS family pyridoxal phosphate-dependent enzyme [Pseudomaricurvus sp. HS19]MYM63528.1 YggS family pyridoxal phosphate-dependent enzyme [Pseudomaricurvus sp. HS19]